jgi:arginine-tRNA-protein transferase
MGPLVVVEGDCAYFRDGRASLTAFALPGHLDGATYQRAMDLGMRRSGTVVYRPLCGDCRKCQPLRVPIEGFKPSRSQRRAFKRCEGRFSIDIGTPVLDEERLDLYARYQAHQHGEHAQSADATSYRRFLVDTVTDTMEMRWRDMDTDRLVAIGVLDVTPDALSSVYFYWDPALKDLSLGTYSALIEIDTARAWGKSHYYLGYLVAGSKTMNYKATFPGAEVWDGRGWMPLGGRDPTAPEVRRVLDIAEQSSMNADAGRFCLEAARELPRR